ncbi:zinc finger BED domain-containing protein RICESLEEPER 2-like protein [Tanacetum coccineum]
MSGCSCVEKVKIDSKSLVCLDVETRWNSTYLMLESAIKFQAAFDMLEEQDSKYRSELLSSKGMPTEEDWDYARCLLPFLSTKSPNILKTDDGTIVIQGNHLEAL